MRSIDQGGASRPEVLRRRAGEFLDIAASAHDPVAWAELHRLAERYLQWASELETASGDGAEQRTG